MKPASKLSPLAAAALAAAFGPAFAADDDATVAQLKAPDSEVSLGLGYVSDDNQRFGQYSGLNKEGGYLLLDADVAKRNDATGTWLRFSGRNLGLDSREFRFGQERQGDWGYSIDYSQIPRFNPFTVNTGLQGIGTNTQTTTIIPRGTGANYNLETERKRWTLGGDKTLAPGLTANVRFRTEEKNGERQWGQGNFGASGWRFLVDPIDQTTNQLDATLNYSAGKLQLSGGYYGTRFQNRNSVLNVTGTPIFPGANQMSLPPDNYSHQLHLAGGYSFTPTTRGTFKVAYGTIRQDEAFATTPTVNPLAAPSLNGRIDTTLLQAGLTARPLQKLSMRADLRYENRDDKTPVLLYYPSQITTPATATNTGENEPRDIKTKAGKLDAYYELPKGFRLSGGLEYVVKDRNSPPVRSVGYREETDEATYSVGLRRAVAETATGAVTLLHSKRTGSDFLTNTFLGGAVGSNLIAPLHLADRDRDTVRVVLNWMPSEPLAINFRTDVSADNYTGRTANGFELGPRKGAAQLLSIDGSYSFSQRVQATAWISRMVNRYENATCQGETGAPPGCTDTAAAPVWGDKLSNANNSLGLGLRAQASHALKLGADFVYSKVRDAMQLLSIDPATSIASTNILPDINTKVRTLKVYGDYALTKGTGLRVQWIQDRYWTDDWTWANWVYTDGTTVTQNPNQTVNFLGAAVYVHF